MPITMNVFIVPFAAGVLALGVVVHSFFSEVDFYPGKHHNPNAKPLPRWYGRLTEGSRKSDAPLTMAPFGNTIVDTLWEPCS